MTAIDELGVELTDTTEATDEADAAAALDIRSCDLPAVLSLIQASTPGPDAPPLRVRDLIHGRLRAAACDDVADPRTLLTALPHASERSVEGLRLIDLPEPGEVSDLPLAEAIETRRSSTGFGDDPVPLETLSALLDTAAGVREYLPGYNIRDFPFRRAPSAGGLAPVDIYLVANAVEGLDQGLYYYQPSGHRLAQIDAGTMRGKLAEAVIAAEWIFYAPVVFLLAVSMPRVDWKYGARAYRFVHVDVGVLTQNLYLVGTALNLTTCAVAAFDDDSVNELARIDGREEFVSLLFACGMPAGK